MITKLSPLDRFNAKADYIKQKIRDLKTFAYTLPESNKTRDKYIRIIEQAEAPINPQVVDGHIIYSIYGKEKKIPIAKANHLVFCRDKEMRATITNLSALMSGKKQEAVNVVALMRREPDGTYRGIDKTMRVREEMGLNGLIAQKTAVTRRMPDGSFKGTDKTLKTKRDNGINAIAAKKTAAARRNEDGTFRGAYKTAQTRRQRGYLSTKYGAPCAYQHQDGYWIVMRSMWEWGYAYWLDSQGISWTYESTVLYVNGKSHIPDFTINGNEHHEIKPKNMVDERLGHDYITKYNIKVVTEQDFNFKAYRSQAEGYRLDDANSFRKDFRLQGSV